METINKDLLLDFVNNVNILEYITKEKDIKAYVINEYKLLNKKYDFTLKRIINHSEKFNDVLLKYQFPYLKYNEIEIIRYLESPTNGQSSISNLNILEDIINNLDDYHLLVELIDLFIIRKENTNENATCIIKLLSMMITNGNIDVIEYITENYIKYIPINRFKDEFLMKSIIICEDPLIIRHFVENYNFFMKHNDSYILKRAIINKNYPMIELYKYYHPDEPYAPSYSYIESLIQKDPIIKKILGYKEEQKSTKKVSKSYIKSPIPENSTTKKEENNNEEHYDPNYFEVDTVVIIDSN